MPHTLTVASSAATATTLPSEGFFCAVFGSKMPPVLTSSSTPSLTKTRSPAGFTEVYCFVCIAVGPGQQPDAFGIFVSSTILRVSSCRGVRFASSSYLAGHGHGRLGAHASSPGGPPDGVSHEALGHGSLGHRFKVPPGLWWCVESACGSCA